MNLRYFRLGQKIIFSTFYKTFSCISLISKLVVKTSSKLRFMKKILKKILKKFKFQLTFQNRPMSFCIFGYNLEYVLTLRKPHQSPLPNTISSEDLILSGNHFYSTFFHDFRILSTNTSKNNLHFCLPSINCKFIYKENIVLFIFQ